MFCKLFGSKKAQGVTPDLIFIIMQMLVLAICIVIVMGFINFWASDTTYEKNYLPKDIGLLIDVIYPAPGNIYVNYIYRNYDFLASFKDDAKNGPIVIIKDGDSEGWYKFAKNSFDLGLQENLKLKKGITLSKIDNKLTVEPSSDVNLLELKCPDVDVTDAKKIMIDAGHSDGEGFKNNDLVEGDIVGNIAESIALGLDSFEIINSRDGTRRISDDEIRKIIDEKKPSVIISLHVGNYDKYSNNVKAYYSINSNVKEKNEKLACLILNKISEDIEIDGVSIVPIHEEDYENAVLPDDRVAILLEIGNIQSVKESIWRNPKIAPAIRNGTKRYFKDG